LKLPLCELKHQCPQHTQFGNLSPKFQSALSAQL
jgi:hypothetical protein